MTPSPFSPDFATSRQRFIEQARSCGAGVDTWDYPLRGPGGEPLGTDVAWIGPLEADRVLVMVSGTHGVEGFCGAGAQIDWLRRGEAARLPPGTAAMLVHAINPWGFAWLRRVTHENVDLNRNFIDFSQPLPERPRYDEIAAALCPEEWTEASRAQSMAALQAAIGHMGFPTFVEAVSAGQYGHPRGLFFGGMSPCAARATLESILTTRLRHAGRVALIDFHSGLGSPGHGELMMSAAPGSEALARARRWYGGLVTPVGATGSASAALAGDWLAAAPALLPHAEVTGIAIEFGTVSPLQVLEALRADNWLHAHGEATASPAHPVKKAMLAAFFPDDATWQGMVLGQSLAVARQAVAGLQEARA